MPDLVDALTGAITPGTPSTSSGVGTGQSQQQSQTYFGQAPQGMNLSNLAPTANSLLQQYGSFVQNPAASPTFQNLLNSFFSNPTLQRQRFMAQQNLRDMFGAAGNLASGEYANAATGLQSDIYGQNVSSAGNILSSLFGPMSQALLGPTNSLEGLLNALKLSSSSGTSSNVSQQSAQGGQPAEISPQGLAGLLQALQGQMVNPSTPGQTTPGTPGPGTPGTPPPGAGTPPPSPGASYYGPGTPGNTSGFYQDPTTGMWTQGMVGGNYQGLYDALSQMAPGGGVD